MRHLSSQDLMAAVDFEDVGTGSDTATRDLQPARYRHSLLALLELTHELSAQHDIYAIAETAAKNFMGHVGTTRFGLWMRSEENERELILLRSHGLPEMLADALGQCASVEFLDRLSSDPYPVRDSELSRQLSGPGLALIQDSQLELFAPLLARGRLIGLMALGKAVNQHGYDPHVIEVLRASMNIVANALDSAWRHSRMLESNRQLRLAYGELQNVDRLKSEFISTMDHELRTPLTILMAYLDMFCDTGNLNDQQSEYLGIMTTQCQELKELILKLLDWKSLSEGRAVLNMVTDNIAPRVAAYYEDRRPGLTSSLREFSLEMDDEIPPARYSPERLVQILDCLIDNAQRFTPEGSHIVLRLSRVQDGDTQQVGIEVADDGPGIPEAKLATIFEPFVQIEPTLTRTRGGIGIGLCVARRLANRMGATLTVRSEWRRGTTFCLRFPACDRRKRGR